jgi:hypothetical protein
MKRLCGDDIDESSQASSAVDQNRSLPVHEKAGMYDFYLMLAKKNTKIPKARRCFLPDRERLLMP